MHGVLANTFIDFNNQVEFSNYSNMNQLEFQHWSDKLANLAKQNAESCRFEHDDFGRLARDAGNTLFIQGY